MPEIRNALDNMMACACKCHVFDDKQTYRMFIVCILMILARKYKADFDFNQKDGCYSITMKDIGDEERGMIIGFKRSDREEQLEHDAEQIIDLLRKRGLSQRMNDRTIVYGASFLGNYLKFHPIMTHMRQLPIGVQDFISIRDGNKYFVDKSMLIGQILNSNDVGVFLYTRPRRFGKSLNLSMMDAFFNIEYKGNTWFDDLEISEHHECDGYKNTFPVLYIDMKSVCADDYDDFSVDFMGLVKDAYKRHQYLNDSSNLTDIDKTEFSDMCLGKTCFRESKSALARLTNLMEKHHGKKVIVLIDEYDSVVSSVTDVNIRRKILSFMKGVYSSLLKGNRSLQMAVITGIMQITKENIFSGLNNLVVNNILSKRSDEMFGFTDDEVKQICEDYGHPEKFTEAKEWYDGYRFGDTDIYNPWSILNYIANGFKPESYWVNTSSNSIIDDLIINADEKTLKGLKTLGSGGNIVHKISMTATFDDLARRPSMIYSLMAMAGYLKAVPSDEGYLLSIPNKELFSVFADAVILSTFDNDDEVSLSLEKFSKAIVSDDTAKMESALYGIITNTLSSRVLDNEHSYQAFIVGLLMSLSGKYEITADFESGNGYHDIRMENKSGTGCNVIMELKRSDSESRLESDAKKALEQIKDRDYAQGLKGQTILYGISFLGKKPYIVSETL